MRSLLVAIIFGAVGTALLWVITLISMALVYAYRAFYSGEDWLALVLVSSAAFLICALLGFLETGRRSIDDL